MTTINPYTLYFKEKYDRINDNLKNVYICQKNLDLIKQLCKIQGKCELLTFLNLKYESYILEEKILLDKINKAYYQIIDEHYNNLLKLINKESDK